MENNRISKKNLEECIFQAYFQMSIDIMSNPFHVISINTSVNECSGMDMPCTRIGHLLQIHIQIYTKIQIQQCEWMFSDGHALRKNRPFANSATLYTSSFLHTNIFSDTDTSTNTNTNTIWCHYFSNSNTSMNIQLDLYQPTYNTNWHICNTLPFAGPTTLYTSPCWIHEWPRSSSSSSPQKYHQHCCHTSDECWWCWGGGGGLLQIRPLRIHHQAAYIHWNIPLLRIYLR